MGRGVEPDPNEAAKWLRKVPCALVRLVSLPYRVSQSAEAGHAGGQHSLGSLYWNGTPPIPKDATEACRWWMKAALQSHAMAQFDLATAFLEGKGVPQDPLEALKWYRKAAYIGGVEMAREKLEELKPKIPAVPPHETAIVRSPV